MTTPATSTPTPTSTSLEFRFPAGRYHATPWGHQVNEGAVEWPSSPWRLLRAFLATWHHKAKHEIPPEVITALIESLGSVLPEFELPDATAGHTRHYMPDYSGKKPPKVFDTFAHVATGQALHVSWPVSLPQEQKEALNTLAERMNYFGRAESLVQITPSKNAFTPNAFPISEDCTLNSDQEIVRLLAPYSASEYHAWRDGFQISSTKNRKKGSGKSSKTADIPKSLFRALQVDTSDWKNAGWNRPPGSRWIFYARPRRVFETQSIARVTERASTTAPKVACFRLSSNVLPSIREAISVADRFHRSLIKYSNGDPVFTGRSPDGSPLQEHHHAHIFCEPASSGPFLQQVTVFAVDGFIGKARRAVENLRRVWGRGGHDIKIVLTYLGAEEGADKVSTLFGNFSEWHSLTPFIPTRHPKTYRNGQPKLDDNNGLQIGSPEHDLRRLLALGDLPNPTSVEPIDRCPHPGANLRWLQFLQNRKHGNGRRATNQSGSGFHLTFPKGIPGPLAFGYGSHFGLGLFAPVIEKER